MIENAPNKVNAIPTVVAMLLSFMSVIWCVMFCYSPNSGQSRVFYKNADADFFCDFFMPRAVANMPVPYVENCPSDWLEDKDVRRPDQCYPALANYWVGLFPENLVGAVACTMIGVVVFIWGVVVFFRRVIPDKVLSATSIACCSPPFLFAVGVGNLILYAVGFSFVFLAWFDSPSRWRKIVASLALALASVLKIVPVLFGVAYLGRGGMGRFRYAITSALFAFLLFFVPFVFCGGFDSVLAWLENAKMNSIVSARENMFGFVGLASELMASFALGALPDFAWRVLRVTSSGLGIMLLVLAFVNACDDWIKGGAIVLGMFFIPPTMKCYTMLYVIPIVISGMCHENDKLRKISAFCCVSMCMLLQLPLFLGPLGALNVCLADAASIDLVLTMLLLLFRRTRRAKICDVTSDG